jgi:hypothetical protein
VLLISDWRSEIGDAEKHLRLVIDERDNTVVRRQQTLFTQLRTNCSGRHDILLVNQTNNALSRTPARLIRSPEYGARFLDGYRRCHFYQHLVNDQPRSGTAAGVPDRPESSQRDRNDRWQRNHGARHFGLGFW